jgi:hypothetical protein
MTERIEALTKILMETLTAINFEDLHEQFTSLQWVIQDYYGLNLKASIDKEAEKYQKQLKEETKRFGDQYAMLMTNYNNLMFENKVLKDRVKYFEDLLIKGAKQP